MKIHVSLKEEINLSNLNNQSSLLLLSGITYSLFIHVRYFSFTFDMYILFIDMGFKTMSNSAMSKKKKQEKKKRQWINIWKGEIERMDIWKHLPSSLFVLLLSPIFLARSNRRKKKKQKRSCRLLLLLLLLFSGAKRYNIIRIMMINKDDRRGDSYLVASHTSLLRLDDDDNDNDEIALRIAKRMTSDDEWNGSCISIEKIHVDYQYIRWSAHLLLPI